MNKKWYFIICLCFLGCNINKTNISGTVDDTDTGIALSGRVLNKQGEGVTGVIARLSQIGFSDTTDAKGYYKISASKDTLKKLGIVLDTVKDTIRYIRDNTTITTQSVKKWIDTLPDVYIIQRNIGGKLNTTQTSFKKIEAILSSLDDTTITSKSIPLWYFSTTFTYSGFAYFSNQEGNFSIYVRVFDADSHVTGRSSNVIFNSTAGDIDIPTFSPTNAIPIPHAGKDTIVSVNDTIHLHASAIDSFGGTITKWEWSINGENFINSITGDTLIIAPADSNPKYCCVIRVTDNDKNTATDSMKVLVCKDIPVADAGEDTTVGINAKVTLTGAATQQFGKIVMYKWDFDGDSIYDDSSAVSGSGTHVYTHEAVYKAMFFVRDDDGNEATDIRIITVSNRAPVVTSIRPDTTISIKDSISLRATAVDNDGTIKEYAWDVDGNGVYDYTSPVIPLTGFRYNTTGVYRAIFRVIDDDNKVTKDTVVVTVMQDAPQIDYLTKDIIVEHGGSVRCSVYVQQQFGTMAIEIDTENSGNFISLGSLGLAGGKTYSFTTGTACSWDSVKVRVTDDDGNVVSRGFKVDIRPQPLTITTIDSTVNTITVNFSQSQESDFVEYRIYRNTTNSVDMSSEQWGTITNKETLSYSTTPQSYVWVPRYYRIYQKDNEGLWSGGSNAVYGNIVNSPPDIPLIAFPVNNGDTIWANEIIRWSKCSDPNGQIVKYRVLVNYNDTGYAEFKTALLDTFVQLTGYDSLFIRWKVIAYDSEGDSSAWSTERLTHLKALVYDIDGNGYRYVTIGTQTWLVENLKTTRYNDGTAIPLVTDSTAWPNLYTPGYCWYNNNVTTNKNIYGALYNWYTVNTGKLAPTGWHVPTDDEWSTLTTYLGGAIVAGGKLKEAGLAYWNSPNTGATNETGFSALPGGFRNNYGKFIAIGNDGYWWSSTANDASNSWFRNMYYLNEGVSRDHKYMYYGFSVRCVRD